MDISVSKRGSEPQEELAKGRSDDVAKMIARRLEGDPFSAAGSREILLKDSSLICRWFNGAKSPDRIWHAKNRLGWRDVTPDMVADLEQIGGYEVDSGCIARGERKQERLLCMPRDAFKAIQMAKTKAVDARLGSSGRSKQDIVERLGVEHGSEAAEWAQGKIVGEVTDSIETVERRDPD